MKLNYSGKNYLYYPHTEEVTTTKGNPVKNVTPIIEAAKRYMVYIKQRGFEFHMHFEDFDEYLETLTTVEKNDLFKILMEDYLSTGDWIRYGKGTSRDRLKAMNNLKRYETLIAKILQS